MKKCCYTCQNIGSGEFEGSQDFFCSLDSNINFGFDIFDTVEFGTDCAEYEAWEKLK